MDLLAEPKREGIHVLPRVGVLFSLFVLMCLLLAVKPKAETVTRIQFGMRVGQTVQLKLKGVNESVIWRVASGKKRVKLKQNGLLRAKRSGKVVIKVTYDGKTYKFRTRIRGKKKNQSTGRGRLSGPDFCAKSRSCDDSGKEGIGRSDYHDRRFPL